MGTPTFSVKFCFCKKGGQRENGGEKGKYDYTVSPGWGKEEKEPHNPAALNRTPKLKLVGRKGGQQVNLLGPVDQGSSQGGENGADWGGETEEKTFALY